LNVIEMKHGLLGSFIALSAVVIFEAAAGPLEETDALQMLERIATAARKLDYSGTFVYQHGQRVETSRIVHFVDADGEHEKLETLDGPRREIIRNNDEVQCYYLDAKVVRSQKRVGQRSFPALLPEQLNSITQYYSVRKGKSERIAGFVSNALILEPRDGMRFGHKIWAERDTGLLLRAHTFNENRQVVEQFAFTQVTIGSGVTREMVRPSYNTDSSEWRRDKFAQSLLTNVETGWTVHEIPPGFQKIMEVSRTKQGGSIVITHMVYSDGMAAVSIFVEPASGRKRLQKGLSQQGAINVYRRTIGDKHVIVLGEAPAKTVMQIANSVSFDE
jgi:sigma-E factor negative regulatory protein RseB